MSVRLAVLSDIHCHPSSVSPQVSYFYSDRLRLPANEHPVESLLSILEENDHLRADVLLVPGDLADKVNQAGMVAAWSAVKEIAGALGASSIASTIGNHDVDSHALHNPDAFFVPRHLGRDYPLADRALSQSYWSEGFALIEHAKCRLAVINSVAEHHSPELAERGSVSSELLERLNRSLAEKPETTLPRVALVHHHPIPHEDVNLGSDDLMVNGSLLLDTLGAHGFSVVVHGHKHHPRLRYYDAAGHQLLVFAAGSFAALSAKFFDAGNLFHILELEPRPDARAMCGSVETWAYSFGRGWAPAHPQSHGIASQVGFGCLDDLGVLAEAVSDVLRAHPAETMRWRDLVVAEPRLRYLTPAHLGLLIQRLRTRSGIEVTASMESGLPSLVHRFQ